MTYFAGTDYRHLEVQDDPIRTVSLSVSFMSLIIRPKPDVWY